MLRVKPCPCPLNYRHCDQIVTVYHADHTAHTVTRKELHGVHLDDRRTQDFGKLGSAEATGFLLVIPEKSAAFGTGYTLQVQDKVLRGVGPVLEYPGWAAFIPPLAPGVCVVKYVDKKYFGGVRCHVEAGG